MSEEIETLIQSLMVGPLNAARPPRDLIPYLMTAEDLAHANIPEKRFLVSSFIPMSSFGMVFAPRGIGKSWFAFGIAKAIAKGESEFLGWQIHEQGDVLFVDGEMSLVDLKERTKLMFGPRGCTNFHLMPSEQLYQNGTPICLDMPDEHEAILRLLEHMEQENKRPKLIVLDNLSTLRRGVNENDNSETEKLLSFLVKLRHMGYAVMVIHHTNKAGEQRGASILEVPMDYIIKLAPPERSEAAFKEGACFQVIFTKVRNKQPKNRNFLCELAMTSQNSVSFKVDNSTPEVSASLTLLRAIAEKHVAPSQRAFGAMLGYSTGKVNKLLKELREDGAIEKNSYTLTETGQCMLYESFPQLYPQPEEEIYTDYQKSMPF